MNNCEQQNALECLTKHCFCGTINTTKGGNKNRNNQLSTKGNKNHGGAFAPRLWVSHLYYIAKRTKKSICFQIFEVKKMEYKMDIEKTIENLLILKEELEKQKQEEQKHKKTSKKLLPLYADYGAFHDLYGGAEIDSKYFCTEVKIDK